MFRLGLTRIAYLNGTGRTLSTSTARFVQQSMEQTQGLKSVVADKLIEHHAKEPPPVTNGSGGTGGNDVLQSVILSEVSVPKWEVAEPVKEQLTSVILPFANLNFIQVLFAPYTYPVMYYLNFLSGHLPLWMAIVGTTATIRLLLFPLVIKQNITGIKIYNILPDTQRIQVKMNESLSSGDNYNYALNRSKLQMLYKENQVDTWSRLKPILIQTPLFVTTFFLLNKLTRYPYEPLMTGGTLWFTDLTIPDPYMILPILTAATMAATLEFGLEGSMQPRAMGPIGRWGMRALPLILLAFIQSFPAGVLLFWTTNNAFTLTYAILMKTKWMKKKFNIPNRINHDPKDLPLSNLSFGEAWRNAKDKGQASKTTLEIRRLDDIAFKKAGVGPLRKTYKEPPVKLN